MLCEYVCLCMRVYVPMHIAAYAYCGDCGEGSTCCVAEGKDGHQTADRTVDRSLSADPGLKRLQCT